MVMERVSIAVADEYLDHFAEVVSDARMVGLQVEQELEELGVVSGSIESARLADLDQVRGVAAVERSQTFQLPPPDSPVQ